jgi:organic hydroperoxide reductase OsmC/OhrA
MAFAVKINGATHTVDVDGDTPCSGCSASRAPQRQCARVDRKVAQAVADAAHETCPYSKATRGKIDVAINVV